MPAANVATLPLSLGIEVPGVSPQPVIASLPAAAIPATLTVRVLADSPAGLALRGLSLIDERTGAHQSITLSARGDLRRIHSGDVKVYERQGSAGPGVACPRSAARLRMMRTRCASWPIPVSIRGPQ